jgi:hypothetical protein
MIIPKVGYDVRKGSGRADPPDVETPADEEAPQTPKGPTPASALAGRDPEAG